MRGALFIYHDLSSTPKKVIFNYNPGSLQRTIVPQSLLTSGTRHPNPYRVKGLPVETISLDIEFDATDQLERPDQNPSAIQYGIYPRLAALESALRPDTSTGLNSPYVLFAWGTIRIVPVLLTSYVVTEEAFDANLNPIRAKANVIMRVLTADDLAKNHPGRKAYLHYLKELGRLAGIGYDE